MSDVKLTPYIRSVDKVYLGSSYQCNGSAHGSRALSGRERAVLEVEAADAQSSKLITALLRYSESEIAIGSLDE